MFDNLDTHTAAENIALVEATAWQFKLRHDTRGLPRPLGNRLHKSLTYNESMTSSSSSPMSRTGGACRCRPSPKEGIGDFKRAWRMFGLQAEIDAPGDSTVPYAV